MVCCVETSAQSLVPKVLVFSANFTISDDTEHLSFRMAQDYWVVQFSWYLLHPWKSRGLELCKIKLFDKVVLWLLFKNVRTLKMIPWRLFISFIFISERISKHPIPKPKEIPEDKNKSKNKSSWSDSESWLKAFTWVVSSYGFHCSNSFHLGFCWQGWFNPQGWVVFLGDFSNVLGIAVAAQHWWTYLPH